MNRWNIPDWLELLVLERDKGCVYCGVEFSDPFATHGKKPSWEHIINDAKIVTIQNIARCCISCNASKSAKDVSVWMESIYCKRNGISKHSVAKVVQDALANSSL